MNTVAAGKSRHILITGASGGLGNALALVYAAPGTHITLWGRNRERLERVREACARKGASTAIIEEDTRSFDRCRGIVRELNEHSPVDMAILNAGVSSGVLPDGRPEPVEDACRTIEVNATGNINIAGALLEEMLLRNGHLVFICSLAALYPLPSSPAYSASKVALSWYARALGMQLSGSTVRISVVYPGYVESPMSRRLSGTQPFCWSASRAASHIAERLEKGADSIVFPHTLALGMRLLHFLPRPVAAFFLKAFSFTVAPDSESPEMKTVSTHREPPGDA